MATYLRSTIKMMRVNSVALRRACCMLKQVFISRESWTETSKQYKWRRKGRGRKGWRFGRKKTYRDTITMKRETLSSVSKLRA